MEKNIFSKNSTFIIFITLMFSFLNLSNQSLKFNIPNNREKCFTEEIYTNSTLLIRYDLKGVESIKADNQEKVLKNIKLFLKNPKGKIIKELDLLNRKGKFAIYIDMEGVYQICSRYYKTWSVTELPKDVVLGIKIRTDYEYQSIESSLEKKDLDQFWEEIRILKGKVLPSISSSKVELDEEDKMAKTIISTSKLYLKLSIIQLILIIIIAFYRIFSIKNFLMKKQII